MSEFNFSILEIIIVGVIKKITFSVTSSYDKLNRYIDTYIIYFKYLYMLYVQNQRLILV